MEGEKPSSSISAAADAERSLWAIIDGIDKYQ